MYIKQNVYLEVYLMTQLCLRLHVVKNKWRLTTSSNILYVTAGPLQPEAVIVTI